MTDEERKQFINEYCRNVGNIKIKCDDCKFVEDCVDYGWDGCRKFTPKPSEPMTNEEWLRSCPPQELIRFLMNVAYGGQIRSVQKRTFDEEAEKWSKWLKEKHE